MKFIAVNGVTLHHTVEDWPDRPGKPALVFINSLGTDLRIWDELVARFRDNFAIIRFDKRGHGLSDCPPGPYTIRDLSDDLAGLLAHLGVHKAILVGISVGGMIALDYALNHPQQVKALVLCDTAAKIGTAAYWHERIEAVRSKGLAQMAGLILDRWFAPTFSRERPADWQGFHNMLTRMPGEGYAATCEAIREADLREAVQRIKVKSLVLCGAEDLATPPDLVRELAETLAEARFELVEQAAHLPCVEQPEAMALKINKFLQEAGYG